MAQLNAPPLARSFACTFNQGFERDVGSPSPCGATVAVQLRTCFEPAHCGAWSRV